MYHWLTSYKKIAVRHLIYDSKCILTGYDKVGRENIIVNHLQWDIFLLWMHSLRALQFGTVLWLSLGSRSSPWLLPLHEVHRKGRIKLNNSKFLYLRYLVIFRFCKFHWCNFMLLYSFPISFVWPASDNCFRIQPVIFVVIYDLRYVCSIISGIVQWPSERNREQWPWALREKSKLSLFRKPQLQTTEKANCINLNI